MVGRTKKLRRSYRTTQAILESANRILAQYAQGDPDDFLAPDLSGMEPGVKPVLVYTGSPQDSVDRLALLPLARQGNLAIVAGAPEREA
ncbi:MAG: hypothetical protein LBO00_03840 [Zoogloeaceae bacterium]|nr:hypothetical protein [Zoogloeaceae bacterium]